ncbi:MAG TPA: Mur ligase family protein [Spirochaetota bacterium]|nr:Mur ligase family protein [Spirochaetota bacterium]
MLQKILDKYINNEQRIDFSHYSPQNIAILLDTLGNPQKKIKTVHVAGTNGKGTVCFIVSGVLEKSGYSAGLFISPHLRRINERISINSVEISDDELLYYIQRADSAANDCRITVTYFDILTTAAFCYFYDKSVDIAVIETGLGGRLDSTNVIIPEISIITDISFDHSRILGDTLEKITYEKCGIVKPGIPVITTNNDQCILNIIRKTAEEKKSQLIAMNKAYSYERIPEDKTLFKFRLNFEKHEPIIIETDLFPEHQIKNAAASAVALLLLKANHFSAITTNSIINCIRDIRIPGRYQKLSFTKHIYFDPAHNYASLLAILNGLKTLFPTFKTKIILSMMKDKIIPEVIELLETEKENIIYYLIDDQRAFIPENNQFYLITDDRNIIFKELKSDINNTIIIFTGTFRIYDFALKTAEYLDKV